MTIPWLLFGRVLKDPGPPVKHRKSETPLTCTRGPQDWRTAPGYSNVRNGERNEAQHRTLSDHAHRQPAAARRPDPDDVRQGGRRAGRPRCARRARARGGGRGGREAGRRRRRSDQRRRIVEAELRHLHQGPPGRLRRHRQHLRLSGPGRVSEAGAAGVRRPRPLAAQDAGLQRADQRARSRPPRAPTSTISRPRSSQREGRRTAS